MTFYSEIDKSSKKPVIILGGGGHAKVLLDILNECKVNIIGYTDINASGALSDELKYIGDDEVIFRYHPAEVSLVNGIGLVGDSSLRRRLYEKFTSLGYDFKQVIHPAAVISATASLGAGVQVVAGSVIQPGVTIGDNVIINTRASIDHDTVIGSHSHISPGATICGSVIIGCSVFIGAGATVVQNIHIGDSCVIGAGSLVLHTLPSNKKAYGVPAKEVSR
ncbi:acetyltransferase [Paenibacillus thiaminolyticus]|uniref:acetyltransferase n=1 Tax=Paenibacillus TaxID=44249 RepID=UPI00105A7A8A|nr:MULTISPECIES: acetyltransferase [Paenibacillus]TDL51808.1 acetyltransferase [Paenibacillus dendritiformis]WII37228.1 acetyltransferase [Paenibacillus thiaminolyticus]